MGWHNWESLWKSFAWQIQGAPGVVIAGNVTDVYARGMDDALYQTSWTGSAWTSKRHDDGGVLGSSPTVVSSEPKNRDVYIRGSDGALWRKYWHADSGWHGWESLGGQIQGAPGVVIAGNATDVYVRGMDNALWQKTWTPGSAWTGWIRHDDRTVLGSSPSVVRLGSSPTVVSSEPKNRDVYICGSSGSDGTVWRKYWHADSGWHPWEPLGGPKPRMKGAPGVVIAGNATDVYVRGMDDALWQNTWTPGSAWTGWNRHEPGYDPTVLGSSPTVVSSGPKHRDVYIRGYGGDLCHKYWQTP